MCLTTVEAAAVVLGGAQDDHGQAGEGGPAEVPNKSSNILNTFGLSKSQYTEAKKS